VIVIAICIVLGALIGYVTDTYDDPIGTAIGGGIAGLVGGFIISTLTGAIVYSTATWHVDPPIPLETIQDGSNVRGSFFLGSGVIDDVSVFTWYEQTSENSYRQNKADASESTVHYADGKPYYVLSVKRREDGSWMGKWGLRLEAGDEIDWAYDFYVPKGTIKRDYTLDAK
jgi:hypothetical protein